MQERMSRRCLLNLAAVTIAFLLLESCIPSRRSYPFIKVEFQGDTGWIFGGVSYLSRDRGEHWTRIGLDCREDDGPLQLRKRVQFVDEKTGFHSFKRVLMKTVDSGQTWDKVGDSKVYGIFFQDAAFGLGYNWEWMQRTSDGGKTWESLDRKAFDDVCFLKSEEIYALSSNQLLQSNDRGQTWVSVSKIPSAERISRIKQYEDAVWVVGGKGLCARYSPHTAVWNILQVPTDSTLYDIGFFGDFMITAGFRGSLFVSSITRPQWKKAELGITDDLLSLAFSRDGTAFAVGGLPDPLIPGGKPTNVALISKDYRSWQRLSLQ